MPIKAQAPRNSVVHFTCFYEHGDELYIHFKLVNYNGLPLTAWAMAPGPIVATEKGALRVWDVHVGEKPCITECVVTDRQGKELAKISTTLSPGSSITPTDLGLKFVLRFVFVLFGSGSKMTHFLSHPMLGYFYFFFHQSYHRDFELHSTSDHQVFFRSVHISSLCGRLANISSSNHRTISASNCFLSFFLENLSLVNQGDSFRTNY